MFPYSKRDADKTVPCQTSLPLPPKSYAEQPLAAKPAHTFLRCRSRSGTIAALVHIEPNNAMPLSGLREILNAEISLNLLLMGECIFGQQTARGTRRPNRWILALLVLVTGRQRIWLPVGKSRPSRKLRFRADFLVRLLPKSSSDRMRMLLAQCQPK